MKNEDWGKPSELMSFIECIGSMNKEGEAASYPKIVRRMWPLYWQEAENKVEFEQTKWDRLCRRRREINRRVFSSAMCFQFFIELSPDKEFIILTDPDEIHRKRLKELEWDLARERSNSKKEKILADVIELNARFGDLGTKEAQGVTETPENEETDLPGVGRAGRGIGFWAARKSRVALALTVTLFILAVSITLTYISRQPPAVPTAVQPPRLAIPEKPSIAALPFVNMSDDPTSRNFLPTALPKKSSRLFPGARIFW